MDYGVFNDEGLLENAFGTMREAEEARDRYNAELTAEGYKADCYAAECCPECEQEASECSCGEDEACPECEEEITSCTCKKNGKKNNEEDEE